MHHFTAIPVPFFTLAMYVGSTAIMIAIHQPFVVCSGCNSRVHTKCSKFTRSQLNKLSSSNVNTYLCNICRSGNLPFIKLSTSALKDVLSVDDTEKVFTGSELCKKCTLCVQCNSDCEECTVCPDNFRVCEDCSTVCNYLGIQELNTAYSKMRLNDLGLVHVNIRSLSKNLDKFEKMLDRLDHKPDIICITETKLNENISPGLDDTALNNPNLINLQGYKFYHTISTTNAGGAGLYVSNMCSYKVRNDLNLCIDGECEAKFVEIITSSKKAKNIIVGSIYRHPHDSHQEFFSEFSRKIECIKEKHHIILLGDINIDMKDSNDKITMDYKNTLLSLGLRNTINLPTRITENTDTILDHIITNVNSDSVVSAVITQDVSDHLPICSIVNLEVKKSKPSRRKYIRKFIPSKKDLFINTINQRITEDRLFSDPESCPYAKLNGVISHMQIASNHVFYTKKLSNTQSKQLRKHWMSSGILKSMDRRDSLFEKWLKTKDPNTRREYNKCRNQVNRIIKAAKIQRDTNLLKNSQSDMKKFWKNLNNITKRKPTSDSTLPAELKVGNESIHDATAIANHMNKHFVEKGPRLASLLPPSNRDVLQSLGPRNPHKMKFRRIATYDIIEIAKVFEEKMSTGPDNIPAILLKWCIHIIAPILADIFNQFVSLGIYPEVLKTAKVTPLHKAGDNDVADNFRSISVLSQINKVFEKLIHERLMTFIQNNNILTNSQFGFRKGHNTSHSASHLNEQVIKHLEKKKVCAILFIDLKAAFDTIDHDILAKKLEHYGIRDNILDLLTSYLFNRKQYIKCGDIESSILLVMCGVPQGSVLGPLLFIIYINDIPNACALDNILYADDAALMLADSNVKKLKRAINRELAQLDDWLISNKLTLNLTKTKYMLISNINVLTAKDRKKFKITIRKYTIHEVDQFKYLGVILDNKLSWNQHINYLVTKLSQVGGILYKVRSMLPLKSRIMIYNSLAGSYLNYGITAWGSATPTALHKLKTMQNRLLRYITFSPPRTNVNHLFSSLKILTVQQLYFFEIAKFVHSVHNRFSPAIFFDYFQTTSHSYSTRTRENNIYSLPQPRTERGKRSCRYTGVNIWSKVPRHMKSFQKISFKYHLKKYVITNIIL